MCDIGLILEVLELQYRGFPALAGAQPDRRKHYNIKKEGRARRKNERTKERKNKIEKDLIKTYMKKK